MNTAVDYYKLLGVSITADADDIRKAYRKLARKYHPDVNTSSKAEDIFKEITSAYSTLSDPDKRRKYNNTLRAEQIRNSRAEFRSYREQSQRFKGQKNQKSKTTKKTQMSGNAAWKAYKEYTASRAHNSAKAPNLTDFFRQIFSRVKSTIERSFSKSPRAHASVSVVEVIVTLEEAISGGRKSVEIKGKNSSRKVNLSVPPGVRSGSVIRLRSKQNPNEDMIAVVRIASHPYLSMEPRGLVAEIPISIREAVYGGKIKIPTLDGPVVVTLPAGCNSGQEIVLKGKGIEKKNGSRGDLYIKLLIKVSDELFSNVTADQLSELDSYGKGKLLRSTLGTSLLDDSSSTTKTYKKTAQ